MVDNSAVIDDFVKGFSDAFTDETGVNTGANTNATYANDDKKYGLSAYSKFFGYDHQLDDGANPGLPMMLLVKPIILTFLVHYIHGGNGMSMQPLVMVVMSELTFMSNSV